ncbi:iron-sulfur cluster-binding protein [Aspergillus campestris IBT 28561]|uniref:Iron-sulfur cluster-binding protein n=1 Tax=Aspergillus campestris (strain IBT 28561) TaxID=1392248 RepID=A0A2I1DA70_ASPC2|nr:iron-sulfur cluster-binding protein [Aspergillus campestris IBT 28561]PKY06780.1 iron-sulfur cluster-binding protein [Aspergillus campestris IBT 28561]
MDSFSAILLAFLAGFIFLYQRWSRPILWSTKPLFSRKPMTTQSTSDASESSTHGVFKEPDLPLDWLVGTQTFELEKRAIFSKTWICLAHRSRFHKPGDYQSFTLAGFPLFLILGKDGEVRAFHNVCRHRAYTITKKESGSTPVLGCRYHGWSYNTFGALIKAPHFDGLPSFDKAQNGLFQISAVTSGAGFVFVNLEVVTAVEGPDVGLLDAFAGRGGLVSRNTSPWVAGGAIEGAFNWKLGVKLLHLDTQRLEKEVAPTPWLANLINCFQRRQGSCTLFPTTSVATIHGTRWWYMINLLPLAPEKTLVRCDLHCSERASKAQVEKTMDKLMVLLQENVREIEVEYRTLTDASRESYIPSASKESEGHQTAILERLQEHVKLEKAQGSQIHPAMRKRRENPQFEQAEQLCQSLDCVASAGMDISSNAPAW